MSPASGTTADATTRLDVEGTVNFREVMVTTTTGRAMRPGLLYRSDSLHSLTDAGRAELAALDLQLILDLRSHDETHAEPDQLGDLEIPIKQIAIMGGSLQAAVMEIMAGQSEKSPLVDLYCSMLDTNGHLLAEAVTSIAATGGPVNVHCTAGKDRTGLVIALTLLAIGVGEDDVVANYALSAANLSGSWLDGMRARVQPYGITLEGPLLQLVADSPAEAMQQAIAWMDTEHGSPVSYLDGIGVDRDVRDELAHQLLTAGPGV